MTEEQIAELFKSGIDCSQVVLGEFKDELGLSEKEAYKMSAAFGGGMGKGEVCGAVVGAMIVLGLKYGHGDAEHMEQKEIMTKKREEFFKKFKEKYAAFGCKQLLKHDITTEDGLKQILDEGLLFNFCPKIVKDTIEILKGM